MPELPSAVSPQLAALLAIPPSRTPNRRALSMERWSCAGCGRGLSEGAKPVPSPTRRAWSTLCQRCRMRKDRIMRGQGRIPLDMPNAPGRGGHDRDAVRLYWERRLWDAAMEAVEHPTEEEEDAGFREVRARYFAVAALASQYLRVEDYVSDGDVPRRPACNTNSGTERT